MLFRKLLDRVRLSSSHHRRARRRHACTVAVERLEDRRLLATFTVSNLLDAGAGSLRQAIEAANIAANTDGDSDGFTDPDRIEFDIPGAGVHTIQPLTELPAISEAVVIDGYTQAGSGPNTNATDLGAGAVGTNADLMIEINGGSASGVNGLVVASGSKATTLASTRPVRRQFRTPGSESESKAPTSPSAARSQTPET